MALQRLPQAFLDQAKAWFDPLADWIEKRLEGRKQPLLVGLNGAQGSGKSTVSQYWVNHFNQKGIESCCLSIDDFYFSHEHRELLSKQVHPLLATRGVPGTHDIEQAMTVLDALTQHKLPIQLPRFNKAQDDPWPKSQWPVVNSNLKLILLEGWCVGCRAESQASLAESVNDLEAKEDAEGCWREYVNRALANEYQALYARIDLLLMLCAPNFECVSRWRFEQEQKLAQQLDEADKAQAVGLMTKAQIDRFVAHYERITRSAIEHMPSFADVVLYLNEQRQVIKVGGLANFSKTME